MKHQGLTAGVSPLRPEGILVSWTWFESYAISQRLRGIIGKCVSGTEYFPSFNPYHQALR